MKFKLHIYRNYFRTLWVCHKRDDDTYFTTNLKFLKLDSHTSDNTHFRCRRNLIRQLKKKFNLIKVEQNTFIAKPRV